MFSSLRLAVFWVALLALTSASRSAMAEVEVSSEESASSEQEVISSSSEDIQPLDHWVDLSSDGAASEPESGSDHPTSFSEEIPEVPTPTSAPKYNFPVIGAERSILKKAQKSRIEKVERKLRALVSREQQERLAAASKDPRGEKELRVCSANFNGYGTKEENERLLKKIPKARIAKAEKSILKAIVSADCDVIAVQGIVGRSPSFASDALNGFATKLSKKTNKTPWKIEIAHSKEQSGYQGFLIKDGENSQIVGAHADTLTDSIMKVPGRLLRKTITLKNEIVPRDFLKLWLEVKSKDILNPDPLSFETKASNKPSREVVILNGILAKSVAPFQADDRLLKLQIADVASRLFETEQSQISPNQQPIVLATIERVEGVMGGAQLVLTGRIKIDDFQEDGLCKILSNVARPPKEEGEEGSEGGAKKEEKPKANKVIDFTIDTLIECKMPLDRPQLRFDVLQTVPFEKQTKPAAEPGKKQQKISKRDLELETAGIFVVPADLKYCAKKGTNMLSSAAGRIQISNGLSGAYLVWVDLNW